ncbi:MAG TPA: VCBS domain-containing protein, partial [Sphingomicrobium sp.]
MRYEDASGAFQASGPIANDDADTLAAGSRGPATGNLITGEGTQYGAAGADSAAGAHVAAIAGQGGEDSSFAGGKLSVSGQFGSLSVDAEGNYSYLANKGAPENVRDRFTYTLADNQGNTDTGALIVEIGKTPAVIKADAQQVVVGPDGVVTLPAGVELSDIMVVGRNLVVNMPDGTQLIIVDGAVFVPQLSLGGVEVPSTNVAALLIGQEPQPAAGETPPSSGGNFALPPPPLDPGVPLGDLLPPTEYTYIPPEPQEVFDILDEEPEIFIQPDGQPASVAAVDQVEEAGLPTRNGGEPAGSGESADGNGADNDVTSETTTGTIIIDSPDGVDSVTINGVVVTGAIGQQIAGAFGTLTITGFNGDDILYSYTLADNTSGNATHDDFSVVLTDDDGDQAAATLRIDIVDDVPTARNDTDASVNGVATGNVMTDAAPGDAGDSDTNAADTVGADNATLTSVSGTGGSDSTFSGGLLNVNGSFGSL